MVIPKIVYLFNDAGDMRVHIIPGYIHSPADYILYLTEIFKEEEKACVIEDDYFENKGLSFLIKSSRTSNLIWGYYSHAFKLRNDIDTLIEKAKAVHFLS